MLLCVGRCNLQSRESQGNSRKSILRAADIAQREEEVLFFFAKCLTRRGPALSFLFFCFALFIFTSPISFGICRSRAIPRTNESARDRSNRRYETKFFLSIFLNACCG